MKATTISGERSNCFQYSFLASWSTWVRSWRACGSGERPALSSSSASMQLQERVERDLGVDDHLAAAGHVHDHVGTQATLVGRGRHLLVEVAVLEHAGHLDHPAQLHLPPAAPRLRRAERRHQIAGLLLQLLVAEVELRHLLAQDPRRRPGARAPCPARPALVAGQRLAQRVEQVGDGLLALRQVALGRASGPR